MDDEDPSMASRRWSGSLDASGRTGSRPAPWCESSIRARVGLDRGHASGTGSHLVDQRHDGDVGVRQASSGHAASAEQQAREPQPQPPQVTPMVPCHVTERKSRCRPVKRGTPLPFSACRRRDRAAAPA